MTNEEKDDLVAYLDGELSEDETQALEARLSKDPAARAELDSLRQVYGLLDYLPRPEPSDNFTNRTMERLSLAGSGRVTEKVPQPASARWLLPLGWAAMVLLVFGAGWLGAGYIWPHAPGPVVKSPRPLDPDERWVLEQEGEIKDQAAALEGKARVDFIRARKAQQEEHRRFVARQPKAVRAVLEELNGKARDEFLENLRAQDRKRQEEWILASRAWPELVNGTPLPSRLTEFPPQIQSYVQEYLRHFLSKEEWDKLEKSQGHWPLFPRTLVDLAEQHPPALPGPTGPRQFDELPAAVQKLFKGKVPSAKGVKGAKGDGTWFTFAQFITQVAEKRDLQLPNELWPHKYQCLSPDMKEFVDYLIARVLSDEEKHELLNKTPNRWPDYPQAIQRLARAHDLEPPWFTLPAWKERGESWFTPPPWKIKGEEWRDKLDLYRLRKPGAVMRGTPLGF